MQHTYKYYEQAFASLHTNTQKGKPAPHKAFLLLAVIDLIEEGKIYCNQIDLTEDLKHRYNLLWKKLLGKSLLFSPDISKPYLTNQPVEISMSLAVNISSAVLIGQLLCALGA